MEGRAPVGRAAIVAGTDGSASALAALRQAAGLASGSEATLHVVCAHRGDEDGAREVLRRSADELAGMPVSVAWHTEEADPASALVDVAGRVGAELIVVGNRGVDAILPFVRRPVCEEVRRRATCGVLVVDTEDYWRPVEPAELRGGEGRIAREWKVLLVTSVAVFMALLDVTIVNVAFPDIQRDFAGSSLSDLSWVLNAYNVVFAALLVPAGRLADRVGRRRVFYGGLWTFLLGSVLCGAAPSADALVAARVLQAAGAAALIPTSLGLLLPEFAAERRATAVSLWAAAGAVAAATGPSLGGVLVDAGGWRWAFYVNLVIALAVLPARRLLVERRDREASAASDVVGATLLASAVGALALGIVKAPDWGWTDDRVAVLWVVAVLLAGALGVRSRRHPSPIVEPALLRIRLFALANAATLVYAAGFYALLLCNVLFLSQVWGYSVLEAGFGVTPAPLAAAVAAALAGRLEERTGPRPIAIAGMLVTAVAVLLYRELPGAEPQYLSAWLPVQVLSGAAAGAVFAALSTATVADLPANRIATGTALASCSRQVGAVLGIATLVAVLGTPAPGEAPAAFDRAWLLMAFTATGAGLVAWRFPRPTAEAIGEAAPLRDAHRAIELPGLERREVDLHGHRLVWREGGTGPAVLLVHGLLDSSRTWRKVAPALALGHRVIVPDLRGHGESDGPRDIDYSLGGHAAVLRDLLDHIGLRSVTVVGHSLGGGIAMNFTYLFPERVERLALVASGGLGRELAPALRLATVAGAGALLRGLGSRIPVLLLRGTAAVVQRLGLRRGGRAIVDVARMLERLADAGSRAAFLRTARSVIDHRGQSTTAVHAFGALRDLPLLILWGTRDRVIPPAHAERARELHPSAQIVLVDGVGHAPQLSQPLFVAERIAAFVAQGAEPAISGELRSVPVPVRAE